MSLKPKRKHHASSEIIWAQRVQALMPHLTIEQLEVNQDGLVNDVVIVNQELVFRFAKTTRSAEILEIERGILDIVRPYISVEIPTPVYYENGVMVYSYFVGSHAFQYLERGCQHLLFQGD